MRKWQINSTQIDFSSTPQVQQLDAGYTEDWSGNPGTPYSATNGLYSNATKPLFRIVDDMFIDKQDNNALNAEWRILR
jgi:hypothetical protein